MFSKVMKKLVSSLPGLVDLMACKKDPVKARREALRQVELDLLAAEQHADYYRHQVASLTLQKNRLKNQVVEDQKSVAKTPLIGAQ